MTGIIKILNVNALTSLETRDWSGNFYACRQEIGQAGEESEEDESKEGGSGVETNCPL